MNKFNLVGKTSNIYCNDQNDNSDNRNKKKIKIKIKQLSM